jgi:hypothetical protein
MLELSAAQALSALHHRWYRAMWIVEGRSAEVASGLNNTISRFGELVTTALMNTMLADRGTFLASGFDAAMIGGVVLCGLVTISALLVRVDKS